MLILSSSTVPRSILWKNKLCFYYFFSLNALVAFSMSWVSRTLMWNNLFQKFNQALFCQGFITKESRHFPCSIALTTWHHYICSSSQPNQTFGQAFTFPFVSDVLCVATLPSSVVWHDLQSRCTLTPLTHSAKMVKLSIKEKSCTRLPKLGHPNLDIPI